MVDFEKALLKTKLEKLEAELNYTTTERDNLFAQAADERRYIRQCESTIKELEQKLETQESMTEAYRKVTNDHHMMLRQIQDAALLAMNSNYDRDQLQLVITQIYIKIMDYGIHPPEAAIPIQDPPPVIVIKFDSEPSYKVGQTVRSIEQNYRGEHFKVLAIQEDGISARVDGESIKTFFTFDEIEPVE